MDIQPYRGNTPIPRRLQRAVQGVVSSAQFEQGRHRAVSAVAEYAMSEVMYLTKIKNELALACPDASEALALINNTAGMAIARSVARFSSEITG